MRPPWSTGRRSAESLQNIRAAEPLALTIVIEETASALLTTVLTRALQCKRLKLKCDRRTPCSSCLKRDTVQRCVYSQAAAEKVDVQTLHNRVLEIERILAQMQSASPS
ncbi:hypothetical protein C8Q79DRAFT_900829, partial [Trametes meyenii]